MAEYIKGALAWVLDSIVTVLWSVLYFIYDGFLTMLTAVVAAIDVSTLITDMAAQWGLLPDVMVFLVNQCGLPQMIAIIVYAYGIRMALNLIPSVVTRI